MSGAKATVRHCRDCGGWITTLPHGEYFDQSMYQPHPRRIGGIYTFRSWRAALDFALNVARIYRMGGSS